jgi:hypothetical protein
MDVSEVQDRRAPAVATCRDFAALEDALNAIGNSGAEAVVVRNGGSDVPAELARFAAALVAGAREAQRSATIGWRAG